MLAVTVQFHRQKTKNNNKNRVQKVNAVGPELSTLFVHIVMHTCMCVCVCECEYLVNLRSLELSAESCQQDLLAAIGSASASTRASSQRTSATF